MLETLIGVRHQVTPFGNPQVILVVMTSIQEGMMYSLQRTPTKGYPTLDMQLGLRSNIVLNLTTIQSNISARWFRN